MLGTYLVSVTSTISAVGILAGVGYLRAISQRLKALEAKAFVGELHVLDLDQRIKALASKGSE